MAVYAAAVRRGEGPWEHITEGKNARDVKRKLAKKIGMTVREADAIPLGQNEVNLGGWTEIIAFKRMWK